MQISSKAVLQACNDFRILMHTSKGEQMNFKFLFIQFTCWLVRVNSVKHFLQRQVHEVFTTNF